MKQTRHLIGIVAFGQRLRVLRKEKGMSLEELAWKADLEYSQISRIERGLINTSLSQILVIAAALNVHHKELMNFELEGHDLES